MKNLRITQEEIGTIKEAQSGNKAAFSTLFRKYKGFVENLLTKYVKDEDEAHDICNIVFLKVHNKLSTFTAYDSFGGWLRILTRNTAIDYLRSMKSKNTSIEDVDDRLSLTESIASKEENVINRLTYKRILEEFDKLPDTTRKVCNLFYVNNLTVEQISKALKMPTGTIKSTLFRTRKRIKKQFNSL
mgnify:FL=1